MTTLAEPANVTELAEVIRDAAAQNRRLSFDTETTESMDSGRSVQRLSLGRMASVVDYPARDMTVTVQAGMTWGRLTEILAAEQQQLPIDVASDDQTIGAIVAADQSGPRRFGFGTLRDYLIGVEAVDGQGRVFHAGGRVVKNVAGYDLCRLMVGSRGQLGVLTQLTFKLKPVARCQRLLIARFDDASAMESAFQTLNLSAARPMILDVMNQPAAVKLISELLPAGNSGNSMSAFGYLILSAEGTRDSCDWQIVRIGEELASTASGKFVQPAGEHGGPDVVASYCRKLTAAQKPMAGDAWLVRLKTLASSITPLLVGIEETGVQSFGRAGNGELYFRTGESAADEQTVVQRIRSHGVDGVGQLTRLKTTQSVVAGSTRLPTDSSSSQLHSSGSGALAIADRLRHTFDPQQVFASRG